MRPVRAGASAALAVLLCSLLALLVACGDSDNSGVAEAEGSGAGSSAAAETTTPSEEDVEEAQLNFARCMREQGIDFPDPQPGEGGGLRFQAPASEADRDAFQDAAEKCEEHLEGIRPELSEEDQAELQDAQLEFARCMRAEGVDVPDPQPGQGFGGGTLFELDENDPKAEAALEKCEAIIDEARPRQEDD